jgi:hypothetical protein
MFDGRTSTPKAAAKEILGEILKECDLCIEDWTLQDLGITPFQDSSYPSPGGCEKSLINLYLYVTYASYEQISKLHGKNIGNEEENERTRVMVVPFKEVRKYVERDEKALIALSMLEHLQVGSDRK